MGTHEDRRGRASGTHAREPLDRPDFIIGGAARSGTTSLFRWLAAHPAVSMPEHKEVRFFDCHYEEGVEWYEKRLPDSSSGVVGEASPRYLTHPEAPGRIASLLPSTKMVFILRDPVERAYSDFLMDRARGRGAETFAEALERPDHWARYVETGHYAQHIKRFYEALSVEQVKTVLFEDLIGHAELTFAAVCRFLGLAEEANEEVGRRVNPYVTFHSLAVRRCARALPGPAGRVLNRLNTRTAPYEPMDEHVQARLREHFGPHNEALAGLLGRALPWE